MRVLQLYNNYQSGGGGETRIVEFIEASLISRGHHVKTCIRDNHSIRSTASKISAFATGSYSPAAKRAVAQIIREWNPDVAHVHNLYPLFSPSVLDACCDAGVPVVMSVHNYGLTCPAANRFREGQACELCLGGHEYHCVLNNCKASIFSSAGYALRHAVARKHRLFSDRVSLFLAVSEFVKEKLVEAGYDPTRIDVLENGTPVLRENAAEDEGEYVAYVGGMNVEKGVETLIDAARLLPQCDFVFVGEGPMRAHWSATSPKNCSFVGSLDHFSVDRIYRNARFTVVPSLWWEPFGLVVIEAMSHSRAVVAAESGALSTLINHGEDGLLFPPGDCHALAEAILSLWNEPARARSMGEHGRNKALQFFSEDVFAERLIACYRKAMGAADESDTEISADSSLVTLVSQ
jgi:glycosyltransferase involved in cell wall biosynthesis